MFSRLVRRAEGGGGEGIEGRGLKTLKGKNAKVVKNGNNGFVE